MEMVRLVAVLALPKPVPLLLERGEVTLAGLTGSEWVVDPNPTLPVFKEHLDDLRSAQAVKGNGTAAVAARNVARRQVRRDLENLRASVQQAADANPDEAALVITSAGMYVKKVPVRTKPDFAIKQGAVSGSVSAVVRSRGRGTTYWWEHKSDGSDWVSSTPTRIATASFADLTPGTTYSFRFRVLTAEGLSDWSQVITFMVK